MRSSPLLRVLALLPVALAAGSCGGADAPPAGSGEAALTAAPAPTFDVVARLGVANAREPVPGLVTAGQLTQEQFAALADAGYTQMISLRLPEEDGAGWEEAFAAGHDVSFARLPITGADDLTREAVQELDRLLAEADGEPTILYCGSANRVGALMALRARWLQGASAEDALALGRAAGMTRLEPAVASLLTDGGTP